ncbi:probable E3 ubiquitin-protein ligase RNF217 [Papaver somniferum]|uniref:probable E3 ubiquitin-protein ligase RNF217 n=1 Tax=Papaver somniferum TaxID=3469 RepID=UPI000E70121D|nr:probable E3 ubiquitin-protein ligase RNF217 [Papaver somniferum]
MDNAEAFFICEICTEQVPLQQIFKSDQQKSTKPMNKNKKRRRSFASSSPPCAHPFCTDCIAKYIQVMVEESDKPDIICPDMNCVNVLDPLSCRSFIPPKVFVRWCDYLCKSTVCERYDTAYCPNPYCSELVLNVCKRRLRQPRHLFWRRWLTRNENKMISKCPHCKLLFCLRCMVLCQDNHQCVNGISGSISRKVKRANEAKFMQMVASKKWKRCPTCKIYIDRYEGCPHIECRCGTEFCYECGKTEYLCVCYQAIRTVVHGRGEDHQRAIRVSCFVRPLIFTVKSLLQRHRSRLSCSTIERGI